MSSDYEAEFVAYVANRQEALRRSAYLLCRDLNRSDDLVQTAITRLFVAWRKARVADHLDAYAHTVLVRVFLDEQRVGWWKVWLDHRSSDRPAPVVDVDTRLTLDQAMTGLTARQRAVPVLRFYQDMSVEQTADALNCSAGTVQSQTSRALAALRGVLGDNVGERLT